MNTDEIAPMINLGCSTPKLFNFTEPDLVAFQIAAFKMMSIFQDTAVFVQNKTSAKNFPLTDDDVTLTNLPELLPGYN